jgi:hypothetical protein
MANEIKRELSLKWIKAPSGSTYLCPLEAVSKLQHEPSEEELKIMCVDESKNPQND